MGPLPGRQLPSPQDERRPLLGNRVKRSVYGVVLAVVALPAAARDQIIKLSEADAAALQGKTVAVTLHERPSFAAMTAGKMGFGLIGGLATIKAGNDLINQNNVADPAAILRDNLSSAMRDTYGVRLLEPDKTPTDEKKAKAIAALHPDADYVLDVRSGGWGYLYYPTHWGSYWVSYSAQVQLIDTKTGMQVANEACNVHTRDNPHPPSREQLHANEAQLLKDVTASLGWACMQLLAKDELGLAADKVAAVPAALVDPLAAFAANNPAAPEAPTSAPPASPVDPASVSPQVGAPAGSTENH